MSPPSCGSARPVRTATPALDDVVGVVEGDSDCIDVPSVLNDPVVRRHRVAVGGLETGRALFLRPGRRDPRRVGSLEIGEDRPDRDRPLRFLYLGDAQTGLENWGHLLEAADRRHPGTDFLVLAGDLVDRGNKGPTGIISSCGPRRSFDHLPVMPCVGNHEYLDTGPRLYRAFFELPHNGPTRHRPRPDLLVRGRGFFFAVLDSTLAVWDPWRHIDRRNGWTMS